MQRVGGTALEGRHWGGEEKGAGRRDGSIITSGTASAGGVAATTRRGLRVRLFTTPALAPSTVYIHAIIVIYHAAAEGQGFIILSSLLLFYERAIRTLWMIVLRIFFFLPSLQ